MTKPTDSQIRDAKAQARRNACEFAREVFAAYHTDQYPQLEDACRNRPHSLDLSKMVSSRAKHHRSVSDEYAVMPHEEAESIIADALARYETHDVAELRSPDYRRAMEARNAYRNILRKNTGRQMARKYATENLREMQEIVASEILKRLAKVSA